MGNWRSRRPYGSEKDSDLLPIENLMNKPFCIENLIFQDGRARAYAYVGAIKVLEKVGILMRVKRVCGVGTGAIVAALLACKLHCNSIQRLLFHLLDELVVGDPTSYPDYKPRFVKKLGWNPGDKLYDMLGDIFAKEYDNPDLTFMQLYDKTFIEFCVVVTNVNTMRAEYWHKKTTPDMIIREALYMSLSLPGMFRPRRSSKFSSEDSQSVYLTGSLLCSNPIHAYDGWWLSMLPDNDFFIRWCYIPQSSTDKERFNFWNCKSLGFVLVYIVLGRTTSGSNNPAVNIFESPKLTSNGLTIHMICFTASLDNSIKHETTELNKRDEKVYPEFTDRLSKVGATYTIPDTEVGKKYKKSLRLHKQIERIYDTVHEASKKLVPIIEECDNDHDSFEESLAEKIAIKNSPLTNKEQLLLFSKRLTNVKDCLVAFKEITPGSNLTPTKLLAHIQRIAFSILDDYSFRIAEEVNDMSSFFDKVTQTMNLNTNKITENDRKRTVGIFYGHVNTNSLLEPGDQTFLYKQGWNSTVAYLNQRENLNMISWQINSSLTD